MKSPIFKVLIVVFVGGSFAACDGSGGSSNGGAVNEGRVCDSTVYYQELLGNYKGQITANVFYPEPEEKGGEPDRGCVWNVSILLKEKIIEVNETGRGACFIDAFYHSELVSKKEAPNGGDYECVDVDGVFTAQEDHLLDQEFWNSPVWPVVIELTSPNELHPPTRFSYKYITPLTAGAFDGHAKLTKRNDGLINAIPVIGAGKLEGFLTKQ